MDTSTALTAFQALSQETRLEAFRLLIKAGSSGLAAGDIAEACNTRQNTMSSHLAILTQAGLVQVKRNGRNMIYSAHVTGIQNLLGFLLEDCCGGNPQHCQPLIQKISCST
ncbi:MAG: metalloregulator ArsR/SmtB family transcription factor [Pseudomonadota bacterium]